MQATLDAVLAGEVEIPAGEYKVITGGLDYAFTAPDSANDDLWRRMHPDDAFCRAFCEAWPASCAWVVEWEEKA